MGAAGGGVLKQFGWPIVAIFLILGVATPSTVSVHEFAAHAAAPADCTPTSLADHPAYSRPLVRARWDRASAVAPNTCLMPPNGALWECFHSEAVAASGQRICWWPVPLSLPGDAPPRLEVLVDLALLRSLAETALQNGAVQDLLGAGQHHVQVRVDDAAALMLVDGTNILQATPLTAPPACTPFVAPTPEGAPQDAKGVCAIAYLPRPGQCRFVAPADQGYLCWWGLESEPGSDIVLEMNADTIRGIQNAEDTAAATQWALKNAYITIWSPNPAKRAGIKAALEFGIGDVADPVPPADEPNTRFALQGRLFDVSYFPRDGILTPCARDGQGTWYWLNDFGAPNGFVGSNTIRAMQLYLAEHGQLPDAADVLTDLLINYKPGTMVQGPNGPAPVTYLFAPGSPFALIPTIEAQGKVVKLKGDGTIDRELSPAEATQAAARIAAAKTVAKDVDFNRQPGTLAQDLRFLRYAISRNPAAPQIETMLRLLGNGTLPAEQDLLGMFPPEAPRLATDQEDRAAVPTKVAGGDAFMLGMASHTLIWQDLVANGAIQPMTRAAG